MSDNQSNNQAGLISQAIHEVLDQGGPAVLVTLIELPGRVIPGLDVGAKLVTRESLEGIGTLGANELDQAASRHGHKFLSSRDDARVFKVEEFAPELSEFHGVQLLFERIEAEPRLVIAGAGHVGAALARLASLVGYRVTLIDDRAEFVSRELFSPGEQSIELVLAEDWAEAMREATATAGGVSVAIVTRGHKQDEDCLRAIISSNASYIGMIGSKRRTTIVLDKLREEGVNKEQLKKVRAPIGLDIGAVSPEEVALAILGEIVAERRGGSGASLSQWRRL